MRICRARGRGISNALKCQKLRRRNGDLPRYGDLRVYEVLLCACQRHPVRPDITRKYKLIGSLTLIPSLVSCSTQTTLRS